MTFHHAVYFWLTGSSMGSAQTLIDSCRANLTGIPGIVSMTLAVPGGTSGGPVDDTYAVALLIDFVDKAAHDAYDIHSGHQRLLAECSHLCSKVIVYDAVPA